MVSKIPSSCLYKKQFPCQNHSLFKVFFVDIFTKRFAVFIYKRNKETTFVQAESFLLYKEIPISQRLPCLFNGNLAVLHKPMQFCNYQKMAKFSQKNAYSQRTCKNANYYANMQSISVMLLLRYCTFYTFSRLWTGLSAKLLRLLHRFYILPYTAATIFFHKQPLFPSNSPLRR